MTARYKPSSVDWIKKHTVPAILLIFIVSAVINYSLWQATYHYGPHHYGLMLSNAIDLSMGLAPYRDIFIQYGLMTTVLHSLGYAYVDQTLLSLTGVTSLFYAVGLVGIYFLSLRITNDKKLAVFSLITAYLIHPVAILPWANYLAFPFLVYGIFFLCDTRQRNISLLLAGLTLSFGILCRENLFAPVLLLALFFSGLRFFSILKRSCLFFVEIKRISSFWIGLVVPITIFFIYLHSNSLINDWYQVAVTLPMIYSESHMPDGLIGAVYEFLSILFENAASRESVRLMIVVIIILSAAYLSTLFLGSRIINFKIYGNVNEFSFLVAIFGLALTSSAFHLTEIFRLATGLSLAIPILYLIAHRLKLETYVFIISSIALIGSYGFSSPLTNGILLHDTHLRERLREEGNYLHPSIGIRTISKKTTSPTIFSGQKWPIEVQRLYTSLEDDIKMLSDEDCKLKGFWTNTDNGFIAAMMPFKRLSVAPWYADKMARLAPNLGSAPNLSKEQNIIMVAAASPQRLSYYFRSLPSGYKVGRYYSLKNSNALPQYFDHKPFVIIAPRQCSRFFDSPKTDQAAIKLNKLFSSVDFKSSKTVFVDNTANLIQVKHENLRDKIKRKAFGFFDEPTPDYSDIQFEIYVEKYPDLRAAFYSASRTASKSEWGREHFAYFGSKEGRNVPSLLVESDAGELIFKRNSHKDYLDTPFFPLISKPNGGSRWLSVEFSSPSDFENMHCQILIHNKDWSYVDELDCADAFEGTALFELPTLIPKKVALMISLERRSNSVLPQNLQVAQFLLKNRPNSN